MPFLAVPSPVSLATKAQIYYEDRTIEQARTVVFLHDWALNRQAWAYPVALFSRGYRTITIDLPGFGRSDQPGGLVSYESLARDVGAVATVLDLSHVTLVAAGMSAGIALAYARCFPRTLAGLVLVGPIAPRWTQTADFPAGVPRSDVERLLDASETNWPDVLTTYVKALFYSKVGEPTRHWFESMGFEASLYMIQQTLMLMRDADLREELPHLAVPTTVFHGAHDAIVPLALGAYVAEQIPAASLVRFEKSGHAIWVDEQMRFNTELTGFIEKRVFGNTVPPPDVEETPEGGRRMPFEKIAKDPRRGPPKLEGAIGEVYE
jgi:non-heme chloroperoxidase